ncbi:MAG: FtsX-like permease family protein [Bacteroidota bacterium]
MYLPIFIAKRYLLSKKSHNVINIISAISVIGVTISTLALIVVLSAFNGLENLVISLFNSFDPDIKITIKEGKTFDAQRFPKESIKEINGVAFYTEVLEENVLLKYRSSQYIATIKGVSDDFIKTGGLDTMITEGDLILENNGQPFAVIGQGIAYSLSLSINDIFTPLSIYVPKRGEKVTLNPENAFNIKRIHASGVFSIQQDFDIKYVLVPISFAREMLQYKTEVSAIEIGFHTDIPSDQRDHIQKEILQIIGNEYIVQNRFQQHELLYKIMKSEKWAVFLILTFILIIAAFNSIASVTMLIIDKKLDIFMLWSMGANVNMIKKIFLNEGLLISLLGNLSGLLLGAAVCWVQQKFEVIKFKGSFVIEAIPVKMEVLDFIYVFITVFVIGLIASLLPVRQITKKYLQQSV